jgi:predicted dehydrogenase
VQLEVAENVWLWPQERLKRKLVEAGMLGEIVHARLTYPCGTYHGFNGVRMVVGADPVRILGYSGRTKMRATTDYGGKPMDSASWESAVVQFPGFTCLYEMPPKNRAWRRYWDIEGTHGYLVADDLYLYENGVEKHYAIEWVYSGEGDARVLQEVRVNTDPPVSWPNPYAGHGVSDMDDIAKAALLDSIYQAVAQSVEPIYGWQNALCDQEIAIALRESDLRGNVWLDLPLSGPTGVEGRIHQAFRERYGCDPVNDIDAQLAAEYDRDAVMWGVVGWL